MSQKSTRRIRTAARALLTDETIKATTESIQKGAQEEVTRFKTQVIWVTRISIVINVFLLILVICLTFYQG